MDCWGNADRFLGFVGALLEERYGDIEPVTQRKMTRMEADVLPDLIQRCDSVINAFAN